MRSLKRVFSMGVLSRIWSRLRRWLVGPHLWLILAILALITVFHYADQIGLSLFSHSYLGLDSYAVGRILYLLPIIYAGFIFGLAAGLITAAIALLAMLPHAFLTSPSPADALVQTIGVVLIGAMVCLWFNAQTKHKRAMEQLQMAVDALDRTQEKLRSQIRISMAHEKKLTTIHTISGLLTQSLELEQVLRTATDMVMVVMEVDAVLLYSLEEKSGELLLVAYDGVSWRFAQGVDRIRLGEGFNGQVAQSGEPLMVEDASNDPRLSREVVREEGLKAQLIVPMKSRGRVVGTLCVAVRSHREFTIEELDMLSAIGNEIGIAMENAGLYQEQLRTAEQLRQSERAYRELFEGAHDAIWVHDLGGNILLVNKATEELTGYEAEELLKMNVKLLLSEDGLRLAREVRAKLLKGEFSGPYEQRLIRKDGTDRHLMLSTSLVTSNGQPKGFQHIARDITEEKRMQENLRFYVQQITRAQEEERSRMARELHDSTTQTLVVTLHQLENFLQSKAHLPMSDIRLLWNLQEQIKAVLQEVRHFSRDLRPAILDDLGLLPSLEWLTEELEREHGIEASLKVVRTERRLSPEAELLFFRIVQEAMRNIGRHSKATKAEVSIEFGDGKTKVTITDNGVGFRPPESLGDLSRAGKLGLIGIQERVRLLDGSLAIQSDIGKGTTVTVEAPI